MKTILIFVSTLDGKVTKWDQSRVSLWSSHQDQDYYKKIWNESRLIVMGSNTFTADIVNPSASHQIIIMTSHPDKYKSLEISGQIEFTNELPSALVSRFKIKGHQQMLIVGGPHVATSFLKEQLIDELWLTFEPKIFGQGSNFATDVALDISLRLIDIERVNDQGTLITKYAVLRK
ncbi:MAG TPA: dihydrofolate reductase family protein [Puia sp.]|jgi:dihydrofolate reductase|nr:dihydrofolate reductase family protein [Puia sp.]